MHPFQILLVLFGALTIVGLIYVVRWERKGYKDRGLQMPWRVVRLSTIPIALLTTALVLLPARISRGMEGLAVFYLMLIAAAPLFWFVAHWLVSRFVKPQMTFKDSARIAAMPLLYFVVLALVAQRLQTPVWSILRSLGME